MSNITARLTQHVTLIVSPDEKQVFFQIKGTPGRSFRVTAQTGRTLTWEIAEMAPFPGFGKAKTIMSTSLTVHEDELNATLSGFHKILTGKLKGEDSETSGDFHKVIDLAAPVQAQPSALSPTTPDADATKRASMFKAGIMRELVKAGWEMKGGGGALMFAAIHERTDKDRTKWTRVLGLNFVPVSDHYTGIAYSCFINKVSAKGEATSWPDEGKEPMPDIKAAMDAAAKALPAKYQDASEAAEQRWLTYGQQVTLKGRLLKRHHTEWLDMLGETEEAKERSKWPAYVVRLNVPISVRDADGGLLQKERNVREVYLSLLPDGSEKLVNSLVGKHVTITGKLDHANTVHHPRPVMADVASIR